MSDDAGLYGAIYQSKLLKGQLSTRTWESTMIYGPIGAMRLYEQY